jgi:hypothetical protein
MVQAVEILVFHVTEDRFIGAALRVVAASGVGFLSIINRVAPGKPNWWQKSLYQRLHESQKIPSSFGTNTQDYERFSKRCPDLHAVYQGVKSALKTGDCTPETITSLMEKHMFAHEKAKVFKP